LTLRPVISPVWQRRLDRPSAAGVKPSLRRPPAGAGLPPCACRRIPCPGCRRSGLWEGSQKILARP